MTRCRNLSVFGLGLRFAANAKKRVRASFGRL
jgi:hypothetical protein